ncbi:MAG: hypothetical protein R3F55_03060 [Alphaproteobacteria bacterium]
MRKTMISTAAALLTIGMAALNTARADDPCAGHGVACIGDDCMVCWENADSTVGCAAATLAEVNMTLPGCLDATRDPGLAIPDSLRLPELVGTGGRTVVPDLPQLPTPQRDPSTPSF